MTNNQQSNKEELREKVHMLLIDIGGYAIKHKSDPNFLQNAYMTDVYIDKILNLLQKEIERERGNGIFITLKDLEHIMSWDMDCWGCRHEDHYDSKDCLSDCKFFKKLEEKLSELKNKEGEE